VSSEVLGAEERYWELTERGVDGKGKKGGGSPFMGYWGAKGEEGHPSPNPCLLEEGVH